MPILHASTDPDLLVGLLTAFTLGYTPDQGQEITITSGDPAVSRGQLSQPW